VSARVVASEKRDNETTGLLRVMTSVVMTTTIAKIAVTVMVNALMRTNRQNLSYRRTFY
jgi:hypothetical protein